jgi:branched-chain amino acid transport system ATP-binding protein
MALLEVRDLQVRYGAIEAVRGLSFDVEEGEIVALIGANGAGKSSTLLALSGLVRPARGTVRFQGLDLVRLRPDRIVRAGLVQVPEGRAILGPLTVAENLALGAWSRADRAGIPKALDQVYALFPVLSQRRKQAAGSLSGGEQQMLAMGRALMAAPRLLLLDEPSMGLAPLLVKTVFDTVAAIREAGTTVLLVEQNARQALRISGRAIVLAHGQVFRSGASKDLLEDPVVVEAFLGKPEGA